MDRVQYLLSKIAEEASEISQIALKTQQFGVYEMCPDLEETNVQRINKEFNDLLGVIQLLNKELGVYEIQFNPELVEKKIEKVEKYYQYSINCGQVKGK